VSEIRILGLAGSARTDSFNKRLVRVALEGASMTGCEITFVDLRDHPLPVYDGDLEAEGGLPDAAGDLRRIFAEHQGLLISAPEYNGSITPLLKNTLDWISRSPERRPDLSPYHGKVAALMAASPGPLGGLRGLNVVRALLTNLGVTTLSPQITVRGAHEQFDDAGNLVDPALRDRVLSFGRDLAHATRRLVGDPASD
jgi:NAD(P)H-dependent FMN reductase